MSIEIADLRARWHTCRQTLLKADFNHADEELARLLYFADHHPIISKILQSLRSISKYKEFDVEDWIKNRGHANTLGSGRTNTGFSLDEAERCAQSLKVLEWVISKYINGGEGLCTVGWTVYASGTKYIGAIHSAIERFLDPLFFM